MVVVIVFVVVFVVATAAAAAVADLSLSLSLSLSPVVVQASHFCTSITFLSLQAMFCLNLYIFSF